MDTNKTNPLMQDIIHTAESFAENFKDHGSFDFSIQSLKLVDDLLGEVRDFIDEEDALYNIYTMVGSYIFEIVRGNFGGNYYWLQKESQPMLVIGEPDYSVTFMAWEKVKGHILKGAEDNIPFYIDGVIQQIERGKQQPGLRVQII